MEILAIGNSFSEDATRYLHQIAKADGENINVANLYIGGCSLRQHYKNMLTGERAYELQYNGELTRFRVNLEEALLNREWDYITLQQASHLSFDYDTYKAYIGELVKYIKKCCPRTKIVVHETWFYEEGSEKLKRTGYKTSKDMLADIKKSYERFAKDIDAFGIIRSGEMFLKLCENGIERIHCDTFHATRGAGRYSLGLLWYKFFTGADIENNSFSDFDEPVSEKEADIIKTLVKQL